MIILQICVLEMIFILEAKEGWWILLEVKHGRSAVHKHVGSCYKITSYCIHVWRRVTFTSGKRRTGKGNWQSLCWYEHAYLGSTNWLYKFTYFAYAKWKSKWLSNRELPTWFGWTNWTHVFNLFTCDIRGQVHLPYFVSIWILFFQVLFLYFIFCCSTKSKFIVAFP